jgi:hypothetical protein
MEPEAPQDPIPKPKPGKGRGAKFVVVLVTLATLVGGVAAGFQIFDYFKAEPSQEKPEDPLAWKTIELGKGFSASLPPNWQVVDRDSMEAMTRGFTGASQLPSGPNVALHFVKEKDQGPDLPSALAMLGSASMAQGESLENVLESLRRHPGCQSATMIETVHGPTARAIIYHEGSYPDGSPLTLVMDAYLCIVDSRGLMAYFYTEPAQHLDQAATFRKIFEGIAVR